MPLYQLFAIAKPTVPVSGLAAALRKVGSNVYSSGGVVTEIKSYGEQELAYDIKTAAGKYREVRHPQMCSCDVLSNRMAFLFGSLRSLQGQMLSMNFMVGPTALADLNHNLKVNEDILRYVVLKMKPYDRLPRTTKELNKLRESVEQAKTASYPPVPEGFEPSSL